ncbi:hypothetical protein OF83DRAFT_1160077 [Amylostereum chailletii]|nr:hypothetical protein OF83DRAFT_1160077 [Amylostereum chailletii]
MLSKDPTEAEETSSEVYERQTTPTPRNHVPPPETPRASLAPTPVNVPIPPSLTNRKAWYGFPTSNKFMREYGVSGTALEGVKMPPYLGDSFCGIDRLVELMEKYGPVRAEVDLQLGLVIGLVDKDAKADPQYEWALKEQVGDIFVDECVTVFAIFGTSDVSYRDRPTTAQVEALEKIFKCRPRWWKGI